MKATVVYLVSSLAQIETLVGDKIICDTGLAGVTVVTIYDSDGTKERVLVYKHMEKIDFTYE